MGQTACRKAEYVAKKAEVCLQIEELYHQYNGTPGYRSRMVYLEHKGYPYSPATIHRYMNQELGLRSIGRPKRPEYERGKPHKVFENKLHQDFAAQEKNQKWCTDFAYLFLENHEVRYNCSILDLYDRSIVAILTDVRLPVSLPSAP